MGIRSKLAAVLALAVALPIIIGIVSVRWLGKRHFQQEKGALFQTISEHLSGDLRSGLQREIAAVADWVMLSELPGVASEIILQNGEIPEEDFMGAIEEIESKWPALTEAEEPVRGILNNPLVGKIRTFQEAHPYAVEILITDARGRLVAASGKTSDYWQADEEWWRKGFERGFGKSWVEGIHFDESAEVFSIDISIPIPDPASPDVPLGVAKVVVDASPLIAGLSAVSGSGDEFWDVVMGSGSILARISGSEVVPFENSLDPAFIESADIQKKGFVTSISDREELVGRSPLIVEEE